MGIAPLTKDGKALARIELVSTWDSVNLKGENENGLTVDITRVEGAGSGVCLFDPAAGRFVSGAISASAKYRIEGKRGTESTALDVRSTTKFTFSLQEGK